MFFGSRNAVADELIERTEGGAAEEGVVERNCGRNAEEKKLEPAPVVPVIGPLDACCDMLNVDEENDEGPKTLITELSEVAMCVINRTGLAPSHSPVPPRSVRSSMLKPDDPERWLSVRCRMLLPPLLLLFLGIFKPENMLHAFSLTARIPTRRVSSPAQA